MDENDRKDPPADGQQPATKSEPLQSRKKGQSALVTVDESPPKTLFVFVLDHWVLFPAMMLPIPLNDDRQAALAAHVAESSRYLALIAIRDKRSESRRVHPEQLYRVGTVAKILKVLRAPDGNSSMLVQVLARLQVEAFEPRKQRLLAHVSYPDETVGERLRTQALFQRTQDTLTEVLKLMSVPDEVSLTALNVEEPGRLCDFVVANFDLKLSEKQEYLEEFNITARLEKTLLYLTGELEVRRLGQRIQKEIQEKVEKRQKEYFLREQMSAIRRELGEEVDEKQEALRGYEEKIEKAAMPPEALDRAKRELSRLSMLTAESAEFNVIRTYLDWLVELPWSIATEDNEDLHNAQRVLDADHYGLKEVKERLIEFLAVRKLKPDRKGAILCFAGPPGVGKTSLGRSIAHALGRKIFRFSLGGMRDEAEIKGHRRTYVGAMPGKILQGLKRAGSNNALFMLDEVDKLGSDWRGDPSSALLEALDPEQNHAFLDHYLDVPFDLSKVMFLCTANVKSSIPAPLLDRMEVIDLSGYIDDEKYHIAHRHLLPKQRKEHGLKATQLRMTRSALFKIIADYTREAGVRNLEREIAKICRKTAAGVARGDITRVAVTPKNLEGYLGKRKFEAEILDRALRPGVAIGLAWTPVGGDILFIEVSAIAGKGNFLLTGQLGEVMNESARIAWSYVKSRSTMLGVDPERVRDLDIHVHFPAGAIPKDGPSAGIAITTALVSLLSGAAGRNVRTRLAMTGEITLTGKVLPVGGIREKVIGAKRAGIRTIIMPERNRRDLDDIPEHIRQGLTFTFVEDYDQVFQAAF